MSDDTALDMALQHLGSAGELLDRHGERNAVARMRTGSSVNSAVSREIAAAVEHIRGELERMAARVEAHDAAVARLELVTAGDERLIDDLGAAIEELQRDLDFLRGRVDAGEGRP